MNFFESPAEFDFVQAPQSVMDRSVLTFYTRNFISANFIGAKISMENLRGAKFSMENLRGMKNFHHFSEKHSNRVSGLKKDPPLRLKSG